MKLIKLTDEHYIIVDDSEVKFGDWYYKQNLNIISKKHYSSPEGDVDLKITHSTQPIEYEVVDVTPTGDAIEGYVYDKIQELPLSEVKELIGEVDVEKKMISPYPVNTQNNVDWCNGYQRGYNQALEDNKDRKWTDADVIRIVEKSRQTGLTAEYLLLTLQPKTEWNVEIVDGKLKLK